MRKFGPRYGKPVKPAHSAYAACSARPPTAQPTNASSAYSRIPRILRVLREPPPRNPPTHRLRIRAFRVFCANPTAQPTNASSAYSRIPRILREPQPTNTSYANRAMIPATTTKKTFRTNAFPRSTAILLPKYDPATLQTIIGSAIWSNTYLFIKK